MPLTRSVLFLLLAAPLAAAETVTFELTVSAGKFDRKGEPVRVPLQLPGPGSRVELLDAKGKAFAPAKLETPGIVSSAVKADGKKTREDLVFVLPSLKAGEKLALKAVVETGPKAVRLKTPEEEVLALGDRPALRVVNPKLDESSKEAREKTFKPFHQLYDPTGKVLMTKGPGGLFTHHRGLYYGFMKCGYDKHVVDTWHCRGDAHQAGEEVESSADAVSVRSVLKIDWNGVKKQTFAVERRELSAYAVPAASVVEFVSELRATAGDVKLDGDPQHAGFHFRANSEVAERHEAYEKALKIKDADKKAEALKRIALKDLTVFVRPDGEDKPGATRNYPGDKKHVDLPWLAMSFVVQGKRYTACYLDLPTNPKEARFSERGYGRFGSYFVTTVTKEKPLVVRYRVWLQEGKMTPAEVDALAKAFADPVAVAVR